MRPVLTALLTLTLLSNTHATELRGKVVKASDGDTVTVLDADNVQHKVRLNAIDAPEKGQAFGSKSRDALADKIAGQQVVVTWSKRDRYGRILGTVCIDDRDINAEMLSDGWAWHYREYSKSKTLQSLEDSARDAKRGLWADAEPVPPWEWRRTRRK